MSTKTSPSKAFQKLLTVRGWVIKKTRYEILMASTKRGRLLTAKLVFNKGRLIVEPITYPFNGGNAGYTYKKDEFRFCRNQSILFPFIDVLKEADLWSFVENKDFLQENHETKKFTKVQLKDKLRKAIV